ncbi:hypothetical protein HZC30_00565 [Candidatus Woesearchaeota archaeon]|nr:hypothetical protein [Candidatus Woesearchaeota archaeon]
MSEPTPLIEIIEGNYLDAFKASVPETLLTSAEVQAKRVEFGKRGDTSLNRWLYTANTPLYGMAGKTAIHFLGGREAFLKLYSPHIDDVYAQIVNGRNNGYALPSEDAQWVKAGMDPRALQQFDLKSLIEEKDDNEWGHYTINTAKPDKIKGERRAHAELVYGESDAFYAVMEMLNQKGIAQTNVYLLLPKFVQKSCAEKAQIVGRGAWLDDVSNYSNFVGDARDLGSHFAFLGVRRRASVSEPVVECPKGVAPENAVVSETPPIGSPVIQLNPEMVLDYIRNKENRAAFLSKMNDADALLMQYLAGEYTQKLFA